MFFVHFLWVVQFLVSKLVACCIPSETSREIDTRTYEVLSLLRQLTVGSDPSLHDYVRVSFDFQLWLKLVLCLLYWLIGSHLVNFLSCEAVESQPYKSCYYFCRNWIPSLKRISLMRYESFITSYAKITLQGPTY